MTRTPFNDIRSFRKPNRKVSAFPRSGEKLSQGWRPGLNDRVITASGVGTVIEVSGDMFLVDLENQLANVWERLTSIKRPH